MSDLKIRQGEWVVVCDGAKALLLENEGDAKFPNLRCREVVEEKHASTHEQGTERPGRAHSSVGQGRSAVAQTDWHDQDERAFLKSLAEKLDRAVLDGDVTSMVIVAPPRALGVLRQTYSPRLREAVVSELDKDMVKLPVYEIEKHLAGSLAP